MVSKSLRDGIFVFPKQVLTVRRNNCADPAEPLPKVSYITKKSTFVKDFPSQTWIKAPPNTDILYRMQQYPVKPEIEFGTGHF